MMPPQKPIEATANRIAAETQSAEPTNASSAVGSTPIAVNRPSMRRCALPLSASAPSQGESTASTKLDTPFTIPSQNVLVVASCPTVRCCLKNKGKNTTMTVVAKAELAQS